MFFRMSGGPAGKHLTIRMVAEQTGLEESRIRFFERMFPEYFQTPAGRLTTQSFNERHVAILRDLAASLQRNQNNLTAVRAELAQRHAAPTRPARIITVSSGKGGVGKTTISLNLALAFARSGARTLLFDADLGLANVHVLAGIQPRSTIVDLLQGKATTEEILHAGPAGLRLICGGSGIGGLADLKLDFVEFLGRELERIGRLADVVVIDTAAGLHASVLHFVRMADDVLVIATPNLASTLDAYSLIKVARQERAAGRIHLLVNQAADETQAAHVQQKICACAKQFLGFQPSLLGHLYRDPLMELAVQRREPFLLSHPEAENSRRLHALADRLRAAPAAAVHAEAPELPILADATT